MWSGDVEARFGNPSSKRILDAKKDGGLDAIVENDGTTYVLQSKYEVKPRISLVTRNEIAAFEDIVRDFREDSNEVEFLAWLGTVRPQLRPTYEGLRETTLANPRDVRFIFITTKRSDFDEGDAYEIEDVQNIAALWYLYSDGFTPPTEYIDITLESSWHTDSGDGQFKTYVGLSDVVEFLHLMSRDKNDRLFAQNVRTNLRSKVNDRIRKTYLSEPDTFWLGNNGIYIVCSKVTAHGISTVSSIHPLSTAHRLSMRSPNQGENTPAQSW